MNKLYWKLAVTNMKNSKQFYLPYLLTGMLSVAMFYLMMAMQDNPGLSTMAGGMNIKLVLTLGVVVVALFTGIFLFYTNSFIMKRRKKELGVYNILGMEKKHIGRMIFLETVFTMAVTLGGGLFFGIVFNKFLTMFLYRLTGLEAAIPFYVSQTGCVNAVVLFGVIYALILLHNLMQIRLSNPIELLRGTNAGEREPKTKILLTLIGLVSLGSGYYIAVTIADVMQAILMFFVAVLLVILGTYCLFTAGSIAFLKLLRKNKKYYYQTRHFTTVSGMIYRMKQNAVGLANICILSTMVLVTVSTTVCMYLGTENAIDSMYPAEVWATARYHELPENYEEMDARTEEALKSAGAVLTNHRTYLNFTITALRTEDGFAASGIGAGTEYDIDDVAILTVMPQADYEAIGGDIMKPLQPGEVALSATPVYEKDSVLLENIPFAVKEICQAPKGVTGHISAVNGECVAVVADEATLLRIYEAVQAGWNHERVEPELRYDSYFDFAGTSEEKIALGDAVETALAGWEESPEYHLSLKEEARKEFYSLYGGMLFLGLFLGTLFLMVTVLIIFYKQISEGYEDKERFAIMEKVGMSNAEVKRSIHSQILTVFFLPIVAAVIHVVMAFPMIKLILSAFNLSNITLFAACVAGTALVFFVIYLIVFLLTSRSYYKIVGNQV